MSAKEPRPNTKNGSTASHNKTTDHVVSVTTARSLVHDKVTWESTEVLSTRDKCKDHTSRPRWCQPKDVSLVQCTEHNML